ncbi:MAG: alpha/beta hydrolase family protein [Pirellulaceae bacterium]|nr:alpha/beta hydrolase family protein [Pirellulaceae bacterium]
MLAHALRCWPLAALWLAAVASNSHLSAAGIVESGVVRFGPTAGEAIIAERFRLAAHSFEWRAERVAADSPTVEVWEVTFPSPVVTAEARNNTVHAEYYRPKRGGQRPAVIVLHILGGDFPLSRAFCNYFAQHGVAALFVKMPYYGPRRDPASPRRMISIHPDESVAGMTQAVLDIRRATAWLAARDEVDREQLGIFGISLGGITGALAAAIEPRLQNVCLLLAGGDFSQVPLDSPELRKVRGKLPIDFPDKQELAKQLAVVDPITYGAGARGKRILLLNATDDEVIPRACTLSLWRSFGEPEIVWYPGGHYSVARHLFSALDRVGRFFATTANASAALPLDKAAAPIVIDGRLDDAVWQAAQPIVVNHRHGKAGVLTNPPPLVARLAWDERYLYFGYEVRDRDLIVVPTGREAGPPGNRRPTSEEYLPEKRLDLVELFVSLGSREEFWEIHHAAGNQLNNSWCQVPPTETWAAQGKARYGDVKFDRERYVGDDGGATLARAVALLPKADGSPSTINQSDDEDTGFTGEIRLPWRGLGIAEQHRRADGSYDLAGMELPILVADLHGDRGEAVYHSSAELPLQMFHFSVSRWPKYRLVERD